MIRIVSLCRMLSGTISTGLVFAIAKVFVHQLCDREPDHDAVSTVMKLDAFVCLQEYPLSTKCLSAAQGVSSTSCSSSR